MITRSLPKYLRPTPPADHGALHHIGTRTAATIATWGVLATALVFAGPHPTDTGAAADPSASEPPVAARSVAERLVERHNCWTGEAPADVYIPEVAVVDTGTGARLAPSVVGFAIWQGDRDGHLYAFCR